MPLRDELIQGSIKLAHLLGRVHAVHDQISIASYAKLEDSDSGVLTQTIRVCDHTQSFCLVGGHVHIPEGRWARVLALVLQ